RRRVYKTLHIVTRRSNSLPAVETGATWRGQPFTWSRYGRGVSIPYDEANMLEKYVLRKVMNVAICCALAAGAGCADHDSPPAGGSMPDRFDEVDAAARTAFESMDISGMGLAVYDRNGEKVFERMYGNFSANRPLALASASKLVSGV